jgi:hypothetical protein
MMFPELRGRKSRGDFGNPEATGNTETGRSRKKQAPLFLCTKTCPLKKPVYINTKGKKTTAAYAYPPSTHT